MIKHDYLIDFLAPKILVYALTLKEAIHLPKPLVICSTGWSFSEIQPLINDLAKNGPLVIAANTSVAAYLKRYLVSHLAKILGEEYDINIIERHHRNKIDSPSGTAMSL